MYFRCLLTKPPLMPLQYSRKVSVVSYFPGSVRGLSPGADVTMHGLVVGHVTSVRLSYDPAKDAIVAPVHYKIEPERIVGIGKQVFATMHEAAGALPQERSARQP